jgi:hypothetical protein
VISSFGKKKFKPCACGGGGINLFTNHGITVVRSQFGKEVVNIKSSVSSVATAIKPVRPYHTLVTPSPQSVGMDVKNAGYSANGQQWCYFTEITITFHCFYISALKYLITV